MSTNPEFAACALVGESGLEILSFYTPPLPLREFTLKAKRIQYAAGNPTMVAKLREVLGR